MNYLAHGYPFVDDPYLLAGTAVPDWLNVTNRRLRVRRRHAEPHLISADERQAAVARGIVQHCRDDAWFHETRAFVETSLELSRRVRLQLPDDEGFRPHFLGHILVEILLDAELIAADASRLDAYYAAFGRVEATVVETAVGRIAGASAEPLATFIGLFSRERFLWDYLDDGRLLFRLNQVMRRVKLPVLPASFQDLLPPARQLVADRQDELLSGGLAQRWPALVANGSSTFCSGEI